MPSVGKVITGHNKQILKGAETAPPCNCTLYDCVVDGRCQEKGLIYQCEVKQVESGKIENYIGLTENTFKDRLTKHRTSINNPTYHKNSFITHIWNMKRRRISFELAWRIIAKAKPYSPSTKVCELCIKEIYYILYEKNMSSLNKRNEFFGFCLHRAKYLLKNQ